MQRVTQNNWRIVAGFCLVVGLVVACASLQHNSQQPEVQNKDIHRAAIQAFPNPSTWTEGTIVTTYNPLAFKWEETAYGDIKVGDEFITDGYLFLNSELGIIIRPAVDVTKLEGADTGFNPEIDIAPKAEDVVYLFRSPEDKQPNGHYRLADVAAGSDVVYYGRVWHWSKAEDDKYQLSRTEQVFAEVLATHQEIHQGDIYDVTVQFHGCGKEGTITGSAEHPFYVLDTNDYVNIEDLQAGMLLRTDDGTTATVVNLTHLPEETKALYNLTVAHANNFYVQADDGSAAVLVHNTNCLKVTDDVIRQAMQGADLISQQPAGISLPVVQKLVDDYLSGNLNWGDLPPIRVHDGHIVDGNHRYVASKILGLEIDIQPWRGARPDNAISWNTIPIDYKDWEY